MHRRAPPGTRPRVGAPLQFRAAATQSRRRHLRVLGSSHSHRRGSVPPSKSEWRRGSSTELTAPTTPTGKRRTISKASGSAAGIVSPSGQQCDLGVIAEDRDPHGPLRYEPPTTASRPPGRSALRPRRHVDRVSGPRRLPGLRHAWPPGYSTIPRGAPRRGSVMHRRCICRFPLADHVRRVVRVEALKGHSHHPSFHCVVVLNEVGRSAHPLELDHPACDLRGATCPITEFANFPNDTSPGAISAPLSAPLSAGRGQRS